MQWLVNCREYVVALCTILELDTIKQNFDRKMNISVSFEMKRRWRKGETTKSLEEKKNK
jgi:hypothetical protein